MDGPRFDAPVGAGGYAWWYVDALSADGRHGLTVIAFVGSVFSPYYAWSGRGDPLNHCAINVALYGPRGRWAMTERGRAALSRTADSFSVGPSGLEWDGQGLTIRIDEVAVPLPARLCGTIRLEPTARTGRSFALDAGGRHHWWPIAPAARVSVRMGSPGLAWDGTGYFDTNRGAEPLEAGFADWTWSRAPVPSGGGDPGAAILYDARRRDGSDLSLALKIDPSGAIEEVEPPPPAGLAGTLWRMPRATRSEGPARVVETLEDAPFYARSVIDQRLFGQPVTAVHESLSLDRFATRWVKLLLPFRMPRRW